MNGVDGSADLLNKVFDRSKEEDFNSFADFAEADQVFITMEFYNENAYNYSPSFDYRIEFSDNLYLDADDLGECEDLDGVWNDETSECFYSVADNMISGGCDSGVKSVLPFRVFNVNTGKVVKLHSIKV